MFDLRENWFDDCLRRLKCCWLCGLISFCHITERTPLSCGIAGGAGSVGRHVQIDVAQNFVDHRVTKVSAIGLR